MKQKVIFGRKPVLEAVQSGKAFERIYIDKGMHGPYEVDLRNAVKEQGVVLMRVDVAKLKSLTGGNHQGVVGILSRIEYQQLEHIIPLLYEQGKNPIIFLLDQVTDVGNFGAIARSAEIFGVHALVIPTRGAAIINDYALKASAGALLDIPVCRVNSLQHATDFLKSSGLKIIAADRNDRAIPMDKADFTEPIAVLLGSEGKGIRPHLLRRTDASVYIPQTGKIDSLNVSVAGGVIMYEIQNQRINAANG